MTSEFYEVVDNLDAAIFTGDHLEVKENRDDFKDKLETWTRALDRANFNAAEEEMS